MSDDIFNKLKGKLSDEELSALLAKLDKEIKLTGSKQSEGNTVLIKTSGLVTQNEIIEEIWDRKNSPQFAVRKFGSDKIEFVDSFETDKTVNGKKIVYVPLDNDHLIGGLVVIPSRIKEGTLDETFKQAYELALKIYDCPEEKKPEFKLLVAISLSSWFLDRYTVGNEFKIAGIGMYAPIIPIRGPSGAGKNRALNALRLSSYKPFFDQSTARIPSLFRPMDLWKGTMCLDEADWSHSSETAEVIHFLNSRSNGTPIARQNPENPKTGEVFESFGLTILSQRRNFDDNATENRSIPFYCTTTQKDLPTVELDEWIKEGMEIQNRMLYFRLMYWDKVQIDKGARISGIKDHRLTAAVLPLLALSKFAPSMVDDLTNVLKEIVKKRKEIVAGSSDGILLNYIYDKIQEGMIGEHNGIKYLGSLKEEYIDPLTKEKAYFIVPETASEIAEALKWEPKYVRKALLSLQIMDKGPITVRLFNSTYRPIWIKLDSLKPLFEEFVVDYQPDSVTLVTDVTLNNTVQSIRAEEVTQIKSVTSVTSVTNNPAIGNNKPESDAVYECKEHKFRTNDRVAWYEHQHDFHGWHAEIMDRVQLSKLAEKGEEGETK